MSGEVPSHAAHAISQRGLGPDLARRLADKVRGVGRGAPVT